MITRLFNLLKQTSFKQLRCKFQKCFLCKWPLQIKLSNDEMAVRCTKCGASAVSQSLGQVFQQHIPDQPSLSIYELSSSGAFVRFLLTSKHRVTLSELFSHIPIGEFQNDIVCQDVQRLTFKDETFDVCTSSEVFEHVEDDIKGLGEIYRVLKPNGKLIMTVPIDLNHKTQERTQFVNGVRENILPAEYHTDKLSGANKVFCFRNYGFDIIERLHEIGFSNCQIIKANQDHFFGLGRPIIYAEKHTE